MHTHRIHTRISQHVSCICFAIIKCIDTNHIPWSIAPVHLLLQAIDLMKSAQHERPEHLSLLTNALFKHGCKRNTLRNFNACICQDLSDGNFPFQWKQPKRLSHNEDDRQSDVWSDDHKGGKRRAGFCSFEEVIVAVVFDRFHLCGMVSRDTRTFDHPSENAFCRKSIFNSHHKKRWYRYDKIEDTHHSIVDVTFWQQTTQKKLDLNALLKGGLGSISTWAAGGLCKMYSWSSPWGAKKNSGSTRQAT